MRCDPQIYPKGCEPINSILYAYSLEVINTNLDALYVFSGLDPNYVMCEHIACKKYVLTVCLNVQSTVTGLVSILNQYNYKILFFAKYVLLILAITIIMNQRSKNEIRV